MEKITKKEFKDIHSSLSLIQGMVFMSKEEILSRLKDVKEIKPYLKPVSNYGEIGSDRDGARSTNIYQDSRFIFVETTVDYAKDRNTSRMDKKTFNTIYYKGEI